MAPDQLRYKQRGKRKKELARRKAFRATNTVVFIICEGKTEREYFKFIRNQLRLTTLNIEVVEEEHGSDPLSVVNTAIDKLKTDSDYDRAFCVFDRDKHTTYYDAIHKIAHNKHKNKLMSIVSVPCFEFWLLLHFTYTTRSFDTAGDASNCNEVIHELRKYIPGYQKGQREQFAEMWDRRDEAIKRAKQIEAFHETSGADNPSTEMYKVMEYLEEMGK
ncbi:RloB domain-containing protein [bacterium]|nr:RloB domain-containing protein [bacterium]